MSPSPSAFAATLVAETADGTTVGAGCVFSSRWHPTRLWAYVEVAATARRRGHGAVLLAALRDAARRDGRPLRAKVDRDSDGAAFGQAMGFHTIEGCVIQRVDRRQDAAVAGLTDLVADRAPSAEQTASAFRLFYEATHGWDPVGDLSSQDFLDSHVNPASAHLLVTTRAGEPLAVGCLYDEDEGMLLSGGPVTTDPLSPAAMRLLAAEAGRVAAERGRTLIAEVDDSNMLLADALRHYGTTQLDAVDIIADG